MNDKKDTGETINISSHKRLSPCLTELNTENIAPLSSPQKFDTEKKFNLVLYGVKECRPGMSKSARLEADLESVISIFSHIDSSIQAQSIKDCLRLGKYIPSQSRSRPILVKFIRFTDVTKVLSSRAKISRPFFVKSDMSLEERVEESLIKERWGLIQSGIERKNLRIRNNCLFVNGKVYGRIVNKSFKVEDGSFALDTTASLRNVNSHSSTVDDNSQSKADAQSTQSTPSTSPTPLSHTPSSLTPSSHTPSTVPTSSVAMQSSDPSQP